MDTKQSFLHVSINFPSLVFYSLHLSIRTISLAVILYKSYHAITLRLQLSSLHSSIRTISIAVTFPCSYISFIFYILFFTIYYSITITKYFLLLYIYNPINLYYLSLLYFNNSLFKKTIYIFFI